MPLLSISEVARQVGLRSSAIRYYEQIKILPPARRIGGQRRYDTTVLQRLAVIQRARQAGFTLDEIRQLFFGFHDSTPPSKRWQELSQRKLAELETLIDRIKTMQRLLQRLQDCRCEALDECGEKLLRKGCADVTVKSLPTNHRNIR